MKCEDCGEEYELGVVCPKCRLERLRQQGLEDGRLKKSRQSPVELQLPPGDRE